MSYKVKEKNATTGIRVISHRKKENTTFVSHLQSFDNIERLFSFITAIVKNYTLLHWKHLQHLQTMKDPMKGRRYARVTFL